MSARYCPGERIAFNAPDAQGFRTPQVDPESLNGVYVLQCAPGHAGDHRYIERRGRIVEHPVRTDHGPDHTMFKVGWYHWPLVEGVEPVTSESEPHSIELVCRDQMTAGWSFTEDYDLWDETCAAAIRNRPPQIHAVARLSVWRDLLSDTFDSRRKH